MCESVHVCGKGGRRYVAAYLGPTRYRLDAHGYGKGGPDKLGPTRYRLDVMVAVLTIKPETSENRITAVWNDSQPCREEDSMKKRERCEKDFFYC